MLVVGKFGWSTCATVVSSRLTGWQPMGWTVFGAARHAARRDPAKPSYEHRAPHRTQSESLIVNYRARQQTGRL